MAHVAPQMESSHTGTGWAASTLQRYVSPTSHGLLVCSFVKDGLHPSQCWAVRLATPSEAQLVNFPEAFPGSTLGAKSVKVVINSPQLQIHCRFNQSLNLPSWLSLVGETIQWLKYREEQHLAITQFYLALFLTVLWIT